jgi:hypothetical protein
LYGLSLRGNPLSHRLILVVGATVVKIRLNVLFNANADDPSNTLRRPAPPFTHACLRDEIPLTLQRFEESSPDGLCVDLPPVRVLPEEDPEKHAIGDEE